MGRPRGSKNKAKDDAAPAGNGKAAELPGTGHNIEALTEEQRQALTFQWKAKFESALAVKKKGDADFKNVCKIAKAELGADGIALIKDMIALDSEEGEAAMQAAIERQLLAARWMGAPLGTQMQMFPDRTPSVDKAFEDGKRGALRREPCTPPHAPGTPQYSRWIDGHHEGAAAIAAKTDEEVAEAPDAVSRPFADRLREQNKTIDKQITGGGLQ